MYMFIHTYVRTHTMYVCVYYAYMDVSTCVQALICVSIHVCMYVCLFVCMLNSGMTKLDHI